MKPPRPAGHQAGGMLAFVPRFFSNFRVGNPVWPNMGCSQGQETDKEQTRSRGKTGSRREADRNRQQGAGPFSQLQPCNLLQHPPPPPPLAETNKKQLAKRNVVFRFQPPALKTRERKDEFGTKRQ